MHRTALVILALVCIPALVGAYDITVEAENYTSSYNAGGTIIYKAACGYSSGGYAVEGFDYAGDWIEVVLTTAELGAYADFLRSAGLYGYESDIRMTIYGGTQGGGDIDSYYHPVGLGIG